MKMMKLYRVSIVLIILVLSTGSALAQPLIPETYVGKAYVNNGIAAINTPILVTSASGHEFKTTVATNSGDYSIDVIFDYSETSAVEGAKEGEALTWYLDGKEVTSCNRISPCRDIANSGGVNSNFDIAVGNVPETTTVKGIQSTTTVIENKTGILQGILQKITNRTEEKKSLPGKTESKGFNWLLILILLIIFIIIIIIVAIVAFLLLKGRGRKKRTSLGSLRR